MSAVEHPTALERALFAARLAASRACEPDLDEAIAELHEVAVERRRRAQRRDKHDEGPAAGKGDAGPISTRMGCAQNDHKTTTPGD
jgi:hypothetical protein